MTLLSALILTTVHAGSGDAILERMDQAMTRGTDYTFRYEATTQDPGRKARTMAFSVELMGDRRLVQFEAPGDVKGTRVLVLERNQMYVYVPAYRKVRRVASHVTEQGFMGTTFSHEDISTARYAPAFDAELLGETHEVWRLKLTPRPGVETPYAHIEAVIVKADELPGEMKYFNASGELLKTQTFEDHACQDEICVPTTLKMVDHSRGDAWTTLACSDWSANSGLDPTRFSVRELQRGQ